MALDNTSTTPDQALFADTQSYKVDIEAFYNEFVKQIDIVRSHISTSKNSAQFKNFLNSIDSSNTISASDLLGQLVVDPNTPQETRCHAFYRMLGLPCFESGGSFYSPGFIHASTSKNNINIVNLSQTKLNVAYNIFDSTPDLYTLMDNREIIVNNYNNIFSVSDINSSVLALASTKVRNFNIFKNKEIDPFDTSVVDQTYSFDNTENLTRTADFLGVGADSSSDSSAITGGYQDSNGNFPTGKVLGFLKHRSHLIKPLMVDPRIDLTVTPPYTGAPSTNDNTAICKLIGAPFPLDKSQHLYAENVYARSPMIDTICRSRLAVAQQSNALSERWQNIMAYVKNTDWVQDADLLSKVYENPTQTPEDSVFLKYINIMRSMMDVLFESIHIIADTETKYHWVPIPDKRGPEYGSTTQGIIIGDPLNTPQDVAIVNKIVNNEINQINNHNLQNNRPDLGDFIDFEKIQAQPDDTTTSSFGNINQETLDDMANDRIAQCNAANDALRKIEIIMGEFSGFGLCDIIAVYLALWTVDQATLVNMLDDAAFSRLYQDPSLRSAAVESRQGNNGEPTTGIVDTMKTFEQQVVNIYSIMDKLWLDRLVNSGSATS